MFKTILKREIQHNLYSLRFAVSLVLVLAAFVAGSLSFVRNHEDALEKDRIARAEFSEKMKADAVVSATWLAVTIREYPLRPRDDGFVTDAREKYLPNSFNFSAWNVFSFHNRSGSVNPFLTKHEGMNWSYIVGLIVSFVTLLFTFDALSGEKESKTLALALSNSVSRGTLLFGKYLSAVISVFFIVTPGVLLSLFIVFVFGRTALSPSLAAETSGFLAVTILLSASFAAFGLLASALTRRANISLLIALSLWLLFAVVIPNSSAFMAKNFFPIETAGSVQARVAAALDDLSKNAPPGSWSMSSDPFMPLHELRANLQRKRLEAEKSIRDSYYQAMFRQFEKTRMMSIVSPVALSEYLSDAVVGGGYLRFRKVWDDFHVYQGQFLAFFKNLDAQDAKSPHWYNPLEAVSTTRKPLAFETVPQFVEKPMTFAERLRPAFIFFVINIVYACLIFFLSFILFVRYDVR